MTNQLHCAPCVDSAELAQQNRRVLEIAKSLGQTALDAIDNGEYSFEAGMVDWSAEIRAAEKAKVSILPDDLLPEQDKSSFEQESTETLVVVANQTTLAAARELVEEGLRPLALNFANGVEPGGGFLRGATAQEETLCRSSALYATLFGDPMYDFHRENDPAASSDWAILSPDVPVFRDDGGRECVKPWPLSFLTCAAPYSPAIGRADSARMLRQRIHRILAIARAYDYQSLVLGAWGCGVFGNDPRQTALDFRQALEGDFASAFSHVVFAIADWSEERRFLRPFSDVFSFDDHDL